MNQQHIMSEDYISEDYRHSPVGEATAEKYQDIIHLSRPYSLRPKMDLTQRAKIFSPYDALRGFDEAIEETDEHALEVKRINLSDERKALLADNLRQARKGMRLVVRYFVPGQDNDTGNYVTITGIVRRIDPVLQTLEIAAGSDTPIEAGATDRMGSYARRNSGTSSGALKKELPTVIRFDDLEDLSWPVNEQTASP